MRRIAIFVPVPPVEADLKNVHTARGDAVLVRLVDHRDRVHDRRPVTLSTELAREWLDLGTPKERAEQMVLLQGEPTEAFQWFRWTAPSVMCEIRALS